jgi:hypothetical protein
MRRRMAQNFLFSIGGSCCTYCFVHASKAVHRLKTLCIRHFHEDGVSIFAED